MRRTFVIGVSVAAMLGLLWTIYAQSPPQRASQQQQLRATAPAAASLGTHYFLPGPLRAIPSIQFRL